MTNNAVPPLLVLEGPDCAGKTSLANKLAEQHGYRIVHTGPPTEVLPYKQYSEALADVAMKWNTELDKRPVIFDRLHLGERVYGPNVRDRDRLGPVYHRMLDRIMLGLNATIVYCSTDKERMVATWKQRVAQKKELVTDQTQFTSICAAYDQHIIRQGVPFETWDYDCSTIDSLLALTQQSLSWRRNDGPGIGAWRPDRSTLLVGEQVSRMGHGAVDWPFTGIGASSLFITTKLEEWGIDELDLYWVNAVTPGGKLTDPTFIERLAPRRVVAMGAVAAKWCKDAGVEAREVDHPQFWQRFHYGAPYPLREAITDA